MIPSNAASSPGGKSRWLATALAVLPGVGHLYLGQTGKGLLMLLTSYPAAPIWMILGMLDTAVLSGRVERGHALRPWEWFWCQAGDGSDWRLVEVRTTRRRQTSLGAEDRIVDNLHSSSKLVRHLKVSREWTFSYSVEHETTDKAVHTHSLQLKGGPGQTTSIEASVRDKYGYSQNERKLHEETVQIEAPPFKRTRVTLEWKNIVEEGEVIIANTRSEQKSVPYSAIVDVTFDLEQNDESPA